MTKIDPRTVGRSVTLKASAYPGGWPIPVVQEDSDRTGGEERRTQFQGGRRIGDGEGYSLLASFTRKGQASIGKAAPILGNGKGWRSRAFRKQEAVKVSWSAMVPARQVGSKGASAVVFAPGHATARSRDSRLDKAFGRRNVVAILIWRRTVLSGSRSLRC